MEKSISINKKQLKYNKEKHCCSLVEHLAEGYSVESWCTHMGIAPSTFYRWCDQYPDFKRAYEIAKTGSQKWWEDVGRSLAMKGNAASWIFTMKNRFGWKDKQQVDIAAITPAIIEPYDTTEKPIKLGFDDKGNTNIEVISKEKELKK